MTSGRLFANSRLTGTQEASRRSVQTVPHKSGGKRRLANRLTDAQVRELIKAFEAGTTRMQLAQHYGISRASVARLLRAWRNNQTYGGIT